MEPLSVLLVTCSEILPPALTETLRESDEVVVIGRVREGKDALESALALRPQVILVELAEPGQTGLAVIRQLRTALPDVGIIALTPLANRSHWEVIHAVGADEVVAKAGLNTTLLPAIRRAM